MIFVTVEKRYGTATVRARIAADSLGQALKLCKDARIVAAEKHARPPLLVPGNRKLALSGKPSTKAAA